MTDKILVSGYDVDSGLPKDVELYSVDGKAMVTTLGVSGTLSTQTAAVGATRTRLTFDPPIKAAVISVRAAAGATPDPDEAALYCVDAPSPATADAWLTETGATPRHTIKEADGKQGHYFDGSLITYIDVIGVGTTPNLLMTVEGVS